MKDRETFARKMTQLQFHLCIVESPLLEPDVAQMMEIEDEINHLRRMERGRSS